MPSPHILSCQSPRRPLNPTQSLQSERLTHSSELSCCFLQKHGQGETGNNAGGGDTNDDDNNSNSCVTVTVLGDLLS